MASVLASGMSSSPVSSSSHSSHSSSSSRSKSNVSSSSRRARANAGAAGVRGNRSGRYGAVRRQRCGPAASASAAVDAGGDAGLQKAAITLTEGANTQLSKMIAEMGDGVHYLRVGVKTGGCSGMSYVLDFDQEENVSGDDDSVMDVGVDKLLVVIANKSLLYLYGLELDYSPALINGGFKFSNPNASSSCSCGKSFGA